jgi:hypothetical protein
MSEEAEATAAETTEEVQGNGEQGESQPTIPYPRFKEVNDRMKVAEAQAEEMQAQLEEIQAQRAAEKEERERPQKPPAGASQREQIEWYIRNTTDKWFKDQFGMEPSKAKEILSAVPEASRTANEQKWINLAGAHGLNPSDKRTQAIVLGLTQGEGLTPEDAAKAAADILRVKPKPPPPDLEHDGLAGIATQDDAWAFSKADASRLASQGKKTPHRTVDEIFSKSKEMRKR